MAVCGRDEPFDVPHAPESKRICLYQHDSPRHDAHRSDRGCVHIPASSVEQKIGSITVG